MRSGLSGRCVYKISSGLKAWQINHIYKADFSPSSVAIVGGIQMLSIMQYSENIYLLLVSIYIVFFPQNNHVVHILLAVNTGVLSVYVSVAGAQMKQNTVA